MHGSHSDDVAPPSGSDRPSADVDNRVDVIVRTADLRPLAEALAAQRSRILERWLSVAGRPPCAPPALVPGQEGAPGLLDRRCPESKPLAF